MKLSTHAEEQFQARYGFTPNPKTLKKAMRGPGVERHATPDPDRVLWRVPYNPPNSGPIVLAFVTNEDLTRVITALPDGTARMEKAKDTRKSFFRDMHRNRVTDDNAGGEDHAYA